MDFKKHLETAWTMTLKYIVPLVISTLVMFAVSIVTLGILAPVTLAGYTQSLLLMMRTGREPKVQDLFSQMRLFLPLLFFGIVVFIASVIGFILLVLPGFLVILGVLFSCFYMIPLMTDRGLGLMDAVKTSYAMAMSGSKQDHAVAVLIFIAITAVGGSVAVGSLFTHPLATLFFLSVYEEKSAEFEKQSSAAPWHPNSTIKS
ncbi:MAG: hypothetical protein JRJ54_03850 [Deltaproteobacteria bacterium]|nr:hypothetical protein [Deltaproteobacteria bacterium]